MGAGERELEVVRRRSLDLCAFIATLAFSRGVPAHHSTVGQFDLSRRVTLRGTISKVDWIMRITYADGHYYSMSE